VECFYARGGDKFIFPVDQERFLILYPEMFVSPFDALLVYIDRGVGANTYSTQPLKNHLIGSFAQRNTYNTRTYRLVENALYTAHGAIQLLTSTTRLQTVCVCHV
jgi:hypothetical protein